MRKLFGWATWVCRTLLVLLPARFGARYAAEMRSTLEERYANTYAREGGVRARVALAGDLWSLGVAAMRARSSPRSSRRSSDGSRHGILVDGVMQDLRFALRALARSPVFSLTVVLVLALGIGANTAIFSALNAVLLRPLPGVEAPEQLVQVWEENPEKGWYREVAAPANYLDWRAGVPAFADAAGHQGTGAITLTGAGAPQMVQAAFVTGNFFSVMGARAAHGRTLRDEETWSDAAPVAVLSEGFWARQFGRDPAVLGTLLTLNDTPHEVVGVMAPGFTFPGETVDLWVSVKWQRSQVQAVSFRRAHYLNVVARLRGGVTIEQANAQLQSVVQRLQREYPETNRVMGAGLTPLHEFLVGDARAPLLVLMGATALLLLLACANVANLLLVRASARTREVALRSALGAGRARVVRGIVVESLLLAGAGGVAGVLAGIGAMRALSGLQPAGTLPLGDAALDGRVLAFAVLASLGSGVLFGLAPALRGATIDPGLALKDGGRIAGGRASARASRWLVVTEVGLALMLVLGAGLLLRSFTQLRRVDPGFRAENRVALKLFLPVSRYEDGARIRAFIDALVPAFERVPGVRAVTYATPLPLNGLYYTSDFAVEGRGPDEYGTEIAHRPVAANYFEVMGVPLLRGRYFDASDRAGGEPVTLINETLARRFFADEDPVGRRLSFDRVPNDSSVWYRIVGVVGDQRQHGLNVPAQIEEYQPFQQSTVRSFHVILHTAGKEPEIVERVRAELGRLDAQLPIAELAWLDEVYARSLGRDRFLLTLITLFAVLALVLATVGVYGVTAESARRRTQEIGVRVAMGARATEVALMILRQGLTLTGVGIGIGLVAALAGARLLTSVLYDVSPRDVVTFVAVPAVLALAAALACALPALRAARLDPVVALRQE